MVGAGPTDELRVTSEGHARKGRFRRLRRNRAERRPVLRRPKRGPLGARLFGAAGGETTHIARRRGHLLAARDPPWSRRSARVPRSFAAGQGPRRGRGRGAPRLPPVLRRRAACVLSGRMFTPASTKRTESSGHADKTVSWVIRRVQKYSADALLVPLVKKLREVERKKGTEYEGWLPWNLLTLIRWSLEHGRFAGHAAPADEKDVEALMRALHELAGWCPFWDTGAPGIVDKWARMIGHQQFWWQERLARWDFARPHYWLTLDRSGSLKQHMRRATECDPELLFDVLLLVWGWTALHEERFAFSTEPFVNTRISQEDATRVLRSVSFEFGGASDVLAGHSRTIRWPALQLYDPTPFFRRPLIHVDGRFVVTSRRALEQALQELPMMLAREADPENAADALGGVLEEHVGRALGLWGFHVWDEGALARAVPGGLVTDFALDLGDVTVLIEVKASCLRPLTRALPESGSLARDLRSSFVKGVLQGLDLAGRLRDSKHALWREGRRTILLVVTQGELYMGDGVRAWTEFLGVAVEKEIRERGLDEQVIPHENIIAISVSEFDALVSYGLRDPSKIGDLLLSVAKTRLRAGESKMFMSMYFEPPIGNEDRLPYLDGLVEEQFKRSGAHFVR